MDPRCGLLLPCIGLFPSEGFLFGGLSWFSSLHSTRMGGHCGGAHILRYVGLDDIHLSDWLV